MPTAPPKKDAGEEPSDLELVRQVKAGNKKAYERLVKRYQKKILTLCWRLLASGDGARELAADIFAEAYLSIHSFRGESQFSTWLYRIALNTGYSKLKKVTKRRERFVSTSRDDGQTNILEAQSSKDPGPQETAALAEDLEQIRRVLAKIPREQAVILMLHVVDGFSYVEISEMLRCPPGTVMSRISRARGAFKKVWNKSYGKDN